MLEPVRHTSGPRRPTPRSMYRAHRPSSPVRRLTRVRAPRARSCLVPRPVAVPSYSAIVETTPYAPQELPHVVENLRRRGERARQTDEARAMALLGRGSESPATGGSTAPVRPRRARKGERFSHHFAIEEYAGPQGTVAVRLSRAVPIPSFDLPPAAAALAAIGSCLELVHGIGPRRATVYRSMGVSDVGALTSLPAFGVVAAEWTKRLAALDLEWLAERIPARLSGRGHLLATVLAATVPVDRILFLDLETLGLWSSPIFLAGVARVRGGAVEVTQYLARTLANELSVLEAARAEFADADLVVTFNGRTADVPWLTNRCLYYAMAELPELAHLDLRWAVSRRYQRMEALLPDCQLGTVQRMLLKQSRPPGDVEGWQVPRIYERFAKRPSDEHVLLPVLEHNVWDLVGLVGLLELLSNQAVLQ